MKNYIYIVNHWSIDLTSGFITHQITQEQKRLGEYQLKLITVLLEHTGEVLSREKLTHLVWQDRVIGDNSLPNAIHTLRVALGDRNKQRRIIKTIPKMGYLIDPTFCKTIGEKTEIEPDKPKTEQTLMTQAIAIVPVHHAPISTPSEIMQPRDIFNSKRLSASLLLIIMIISGLGYWVL